MPELPLRSDGRRPDEARHIIIETEFQPYAEGSALIRCGNTHVICSASVSEGVPNWRRGSGMGWITAEYGMLPRSTHSRTPREARKGRQGGRSLEIQRLIGRSLRAVADMRQLGERTITLDCDVIRADGGTRTAAISGSYVALYLACAHLKASGVIPRIPLFDAVGAISLGYVRDALLLDLSYDEDSKAQSDFNIVMTAEGNFVEVQGSAEGAPFSHAQLNTLLALAAQGLKPIFAAQTEALKGSS